MKNLNITEMNSINGGDFWGGFCAVSTFIAIASGGTIPGANLAAAGCFFLYY